MHFLTYRPTDALTHARTDVYGLTGLLLATVPAHSDVDEMPLLEPPNGSPSPPRFPLWAHVLYLDVANGVAAPTVLWDDEHMHSRSVVVVPAVPSRLLRFEGSWVHAVPKPAAEHLGEEQTEEEEAEEAARGGVLRHVLLFNTWPDAPPEGEPSRPAAVADLNPGSADPGEDSPAVGSSGGTTFRATPFPTWRSTSTLVRGGQLAGGSTAATATANEANEGSPAQRPPRTGQGTPCHAMRCPALPCLALPCPAPCPALPGPLPGPLPHSVPQSERRAFMLWTVGEPAGTEAADGSSDHAEGRTRAPITQPTTTTTTAFVARLMGGPRRRGRSERS